MRRISINELSTYRWTFEQDLDQYARAGLSIIGVWRNKLVECGEEQAINLLLQSPLSVSNLVWAGGFTGSCGLAFQDSVEDALEAIRIAAAIGAPCVVVYSGGLNNHIQKQAWRLLDGALEGLLPTAELLDVKLAVEPMHPRAAQQCSFITTVEAAVDLVHRHRSDHLGIAFDTYHFGRDKAARQTAQEYIHNIAIVHVADSLNLPNADQQRCPLGSGTVPLGDVVAGLESAGYQGGYDVELVGADEPAHYERLVTDSFEVMQQMLCKERSIGR